MRRPRSAEELAELAPNMRPPPARGARLPVTVELLLDGSRCIRRCCRRRFAGDGPSRVYQRFAVPAGRHELIARLRDSDRRDGFDYERTATIELAPAQSVAIDFRPEMGGFVFR